MKDMFIQKHLKIVTLKFIFPVVIFICFINFFHFISKPDSKNLHVPSDVEQVTMVADKTDKSDMIKRAQQCYIDRLNPSKTFQTKWFEIADIFDACSKEIINFIPYMETTAATVERKYYMMPNILYIQNPCSIVTFGIGGDVFSELHMKMMLPHCTFLGFDPNGSYKNLFEKDLGGKFVKAGVASKKSDNTILQINSNNIFQKVKETNLKSAAELLQTFHGTKKLIDILNVDIEGFEYSIIEEMMTKKIYQNACQINFEIHPVWIHNIGYSIEDVINMLINIAKDGTFLWAKTASNKNITYCIYFVNVKNPNCIEKYLQHRLINY